MSSSARLKYRIVKCTSEDPEFPVSELLTHSSQTKGWQTARFCDFPQEIGLQFETPVHLRQVQFLSHQSKIATKIELYTALPTAGHEQRYESVPFKRLGYLSLDNNERSQFQARELKSVYVDVSAQFIRILLHKCHVNRYNIVNQVGLIALNCLGEALGPDLAIGPPPPNPALARGPGGYQQQQQQQQQAAPQAPAPAVQQPPVQSQQDSAQAAADEMRYDPQTLERIRALTTAKVRAVEAEDYEEAKRCKEMLARLRQTGLLLRELEDRKKLAVQNEDYDAAKALKSEVERLRMAIERPEQPPPQQLRGSGGSSFAGDRPNSGRSGSGGRAAAASPDLFGPPGIPQQSAPRGGHQPQMTPAPLSFSPEPDTAPPHGKRSPSPPAAYGGLPPPPAFSGPLQRDAEPVPQDDGFQSGPPARRETASPPLPGNGGARVARTPPPLAGMASARGGPSELPPEQPPLSERGGAAFDAANHPLSGVPNIEDLSQPEPLHANFQKEAEPLIALIGEYVTRCVYAKSWNLRDAALQKLTLDLQNGVYQDTDPSRLLAAYVQVLKRMVPDKNVQVFLSGAALLQAMCRKLLGKGSHLRRPEVQAALDSLMPLLVDRLGDSNARVDKTARDAHLDFMRCSAVGAAFTGQHLLRPPKKKAVNPRVYISRLQLLAAMVTEAGVQPESKEGLPLDPTVQLAMDWFKNANAEVRDSAVKLVAACYAHAGLARIEKYLANIRQAQREIFDEEFDKVDSGEGLGAGNADGLGSLPTPQRPPPRGAASNRSSPKGGLQGGAVTSLPVHEEEPAEEDDAGFQQADPTTCEFCGLHNPTFTQESMDVHYWRECPMLAQCEFCEQVVETSSLAQHLKEECEKGRREDLDLNSCPFCGTSVGDATEQEWRQHLLVDGCVNNPRDKNRLALQQQPA
eukprot:TRINITY_DN1397_c4_g1_i1.p1 TRINITY_DN1397_c4_g1~~TRINITY_DN1397_c4_g1_i1.p1  ORF type:complete len:915 (-),score=205.75 TRINITY_DN1397_c4_g1_i1:39-2783(-)